MESPSSRTRRRPCFIEEDDGLVSLAETQPEFSGNNNQNHNINLFSRPLYYTLSTRRRNSLKNLSSFSSSSSSLLSPRSVVTARFEEPHQYFLDACFLCKKRIGDNSDIFMYRGDTPFCSEECRQQQIEKDEAKDRKRNISSIKAMRKKDQRQQQSTSSNQTSEDYSLRPGTVAAA
ncbi:FCS-Like Zinc finger 1 [Solanum dulcamara]|uniref:FCS-Like Zinc finger 1 n=1 Tax=Solanum dulcamara TaxID=45834 RepID=UPI00248524C6|nr:FCS-Like Zinc finger 1 [Solanum dulcamara]